MYPDLHTITYRLRANMWMSSEWVKVRVGWHLYWKTVLKYLQDTVWATLYAFTEISTGESKSFRQKSPRKFSFYCFCLINNQERVMGLQKSCGAVSLPRGLQAFQKQADSLSSVTVSPDDPMFTVTSNVSMAMNLPFLIQRGRDMQHQPCISYITLLTW